MSRRRHELTEFEGSVIQPLLPDKPCGVPRIDDRKVLNGILWRFRTGSPWRMSRTAMVPARRAITALGDGCMGHSRRGLTTKIHALVGATGLPVRLEPTAGQVHDSQPALDMIDCLGKGISCWRTFAHGCRQSCIEFVPGRRSRHSSSALEFFVVVVPPVGDFQAGGEPRTAFLLRVIDEIGEA